MTGVRVGGAARKDSLLLGLGSSVLVAATPTGPAEAPVGLGTAGSVAVLAVAG